MTPHGILDDTSDAQPGRRHEHRRQEDDASPFARNIGYALAVVSIAGSVFVAGYNWRSVAILELQQEQFVRKDVQQEQLRNINDRLYDISKQLEQVRGELEKERTKR